MRVAVLGRTRWLLESAEALRAAGHEIPLIGTCRAESCYDASEEDFRRFAHEIGATFFSDADLNAAARVDALYAARCDVAVSVNWMTVIGARALQAFSHGVLNAHAGDVPRYRGNACPNWAILQGESSVTLVVHRMEPDGVDTGPVLLREQMALDANTYIGDVYAWIGSRLPAMFVQAVNAIAAGGAVFKAQSTDASLWLRCYPRRPEDARIRWTDSAEQVRRLIRASSRPLDGAFAFLEGGRRVTVWRADLAEHPGRFLAVPGQVLSRMAGDPVVACGEGVLRLTDVAVEGCADPAQAKALIASSLRNRLT